MLDWAQIMAPLSGGEGDRRVLAAEAPLSPERSTPNWLSRVHAPADVARP